ncbi:OmpW Outer membrane protein W [Methylophilaceae bacterium]
MKKSLLVLAVLSAFAPVLAQAEAGDIVVRLRTAYVVPDEHSKLSHPAISTTARLEVDNNTIPELDISYYFTKNIAAELILATGTRHDVNIVGATGAGLGDQKLGSVNILPPTLTAQWHFNPDQMIDPYVGAGVNYTHSFDRTLATTGGLPIHIDQNMFGIVGQVGVDVNLGSGWLINADVKYVKLNTDVKLNTGTWVKIDDLDINPWVIGVGIGKKF